MMRRSLMWKVGLFLVLVVGAESAFVLFTIVKTRDQMLGDYYKGELDMLEDVGALDDCDADPKGWSIPNRGRGLIVPLGPDGRPLNPDAKAEDVSGEAHKAAVGKPVRVGSDQLGLSEVRVRERSGACNTFLVTPPEASIARGAPFLRILVTRLFTAMVSVGLLVLLIAAPLVRRIKVLSEDADQVIQDNFKGEVSAGVDELGHLAQAFNKATSKARDQLDAEAYQQEMLHQLFADLSHDIRTPLASMKLSAGRLVHGVDPEIDGRSLRAELEYLDAMFVNMATIARLRSTVLPIKPRPFEINGLVERLESRFGVVAADKGLSVHTSMPEEPIECFLDPLTMEQALGNIVHNATKYARANVAVLLFEEGESIVVQVLDDGPGPDPQELPRLKERRFRGFDQGGRKGMGLGLAISEQIVQRHGGTLTIDPYEEGGTKVEVRLPLRSASGEALGARNPGDAG